MKIRLLSDTRIESSDVLLTPREMQDILPITDREAETVFKGRRDIENIIDGKDKRKFIVVGPCSIHDVNLALDYAKKLKKLSDLVQDKLLLIMRVYFEKPRTTIGWKGLINDPNIDGSFEIEKGLLIARKLLLKIAQIGLPAATEALDPITPQYLSDLISWAAIGARTIESQTHRELASGLSMPIGLKNGTDGNIEVALNAMEAARTPHSFLGMNEKGEVSILTTKGNEYNQIILRGGGGKTNYDKETVKLVEKQLRERGLQEEIVIDCSHGNSNKDHRKQKEVFANIIDQIIAGDSAIVGLMLESNIYEGNQPIPDDIRDLKYGVSITDKCISWSDTEEIILQAYNKL
jgi:3-deoxy-7-phosphoheptulonate synthase